MRKSTETIRTSRFVWTILPLPCMSVYSVVENPEGDAVVFSEECRIEARILWL